MGLEFYSVKTLTPLHSIKEGMFLLRASSQIVQKSLRPKILCFLSGRCRITLRSGFDEIVDAGDVFILPQSCRHSYASVDADKDTRIVTFGLFFTLNPLKKRPNRDRELQTVLETLLEKPMILRGGLDLEMRRLVRDFRLEQDGFRLGKKTRLRALAQSILVVLARRLTEPDNPGRIGLRAPNYLVHQAKEFMSKSMTLPLTLGQIAWHVKLSEEHLARIFKKETNMTVMDYLRYLRVDAAKTYLLNSNETIEALAGRLGFGSVNPFCRAFKNLTGQTPTSFRSSHPGVRAEKPVAPVLEKYHATKPEPPRDPSAVAAANDRDPHPRSTRTEKLSSGLDFKPVGGSKRKKKV